MEAKFRTQYFMFLKDTKKTKNFFVVFFVFNFLLSISDKLCLIISMHKVVHPIQFFLFLFIMFISSKTQFGSNPATYFACVDPSICKITCWQCCKYILHSSCYKKTNLLIMSQIFFLFFVICPSFFINITL